MRTDYKSDRAERAENTIWGQRVPRNFPKGGYKLYLPFLNKFVGNSDELNEERVCAKFAHTAKDGKNLLTVNGWRTAPS